MVQEDLTLKGRIIAITRPREQSEEAGKIIEKKGGKPYFIPTIEIKAPSDLSTIKKFINALARNEIDYVIFMSINGVRYLLSAAESFDAKAQLKEYLARTTIVAVGPKTAQELKNHQIHVDLIPEKYSAEGIIQSLKQCGVSGKSIYIPRTNEAPPALARQLREMGGKVQEVYVYESRLPTDYNSKSFFQDLIGGKIHAIIFSSSLGVKNLFRMCDEQVSLEKLLDVINSKLTIVAIGPATAKTLTEMGLRVDVMPKEYLFEEALDALALYWHET